MRNRSLLLLSLLAAAPTPGQTVLPPYSSAYSVDALGQISMAGNYGGIAFKHDDPNVLLFGAYNSNRILALPVVRNAQGTITGFGTPTVHATVGGVDGGLAYGPGNVLFHTWYGANQLGQLRPGSTADDKVIPLTPLGIAYSVGSCAFVPAGHPAAGRFKVVSYSASTWYDVTLAADGNGTWSITNVSAPIQLAGGPEGILYPPANAPMLGGHKFVLVAAWNGPGVVAYATDSLGDPIPSSASVVMTGLSGNAGGTVDPITGDMLFSGNGGRLVALRATAVCGTATNYGTGTPGLTGVPALSGSGCVRLGDSLQVAVTGGRPGALGVLLVGTFPSNATVLGIQVLTNGRITVNHGLNGSGAFGLLLPIPPDPSLGNQHFYLQAVYLDAAAASGLSATAGLDVHIR